MIQRKQSLYLFIAAIFCVSYWFGNPTFATKTGIKSILKGTEEILNAKLKFTKTELSYTSSQVEPQIYEHSYIVYTIAVIAFLSIISIFIFKKRPLQLRLTSYLIMFDLLLLFLIYFQSAQVSKVFDSVQTEWKVFAFMPIILPILHLLALRGIIHDIKLLKAVDRLR
jgi:hypothetical protein